MDKFVSKCISIYPSIMKIKAGKSILLLPLAIGLGKQNLTGQSQISNQPIKRSAS